MKNKPHLEIKNELFVLLVSQTILHDHEHHAYDKTEKSLSSSQAHEKCSQEPGKETMIVQKGGISNSGSVSHS